MRWPLPLRRVAVASGHLSPSARRQFGRLVRETASIRRGCESEGNLVPRCEPLRGFSSTPSYLLRRHIFGPVCQASEAMQNCCILSHAGHAKVKTAVLIGAHFHLRELPGCANSFIKSVNWVNR